MKTRRVWFGHFLALLAVVLVPPVFAAAARFEWNVFLGPWQILGPFPTPNHDDGSGLRTDYLGGEPQCNPATAVQYAGQRYQWRAYDRRVLDFVDAFLATNYPGHVVAYARTAFTSDADREAVLALGSDDSVRAWLNGELVLDHVADRPSMLDSDKVPVQLRRGENVLLLKVENGYGNWGALARLLPAKLDAPLLTFEWRAARPLDAFRHYELPELTVEFLDATGRAMTRHRVSGYRAQNPQRPEYRLYAATPARPPREVRVRISDLRYRPLEKVVSWDEARRGPVAVEAQGDRRLSGRVLDAQTGQPIANARFVVGDSVLAARSDADGRFEIAGLEPLAARLAVAAAGYRTALARITEPLDVRLMPGGKLLRGRIVDEAGQPIPNARVRDTRPDPEPRDVTDADGRFVLSGLPDTAEQVWPVVEHPDFVPLMHFSERITTGEVTWTMRRGVVVTGRVTEKATGRPIPGVRVVAGRDRFASNTAIPEALTDDEGRYRLGSVNPNGELVHAFSDPYAPAMQTVTVAAGRAVEANFELERGADVTGRVVDPAGRPLAGVWLVTDTWNGARMFPRETRTDTNGEFRLPHMPATPVSVDVLKKDYISQRDVLMTGGGHYELVLQPSVAHTVRVRLKDSDRVPSDVQIAVGYIFESGGRTNWESRSLSEASWDPTNAVLTVTLREPARYERLYRFRAPGYRDGILAEPRETQTAQTLEVVLEPAPTVRGRVVDADSGAPLAGITVAILSRQDRMLPGYSNLADYWNEMRFTGPHTVSAADGTFTLPVPEANTDLLLIKREAGFHYIRNAALLVEDGAMELPFPTPARLRGRALVAGQPVPRETIQIWWQPPASGEDAWQLPFQFSGNVRSDEQGQFEIAGLGPGRYRVGRVRRLDRNGLHWMSTSVDTREVVLLPGQTVEADVDRPAGFEVTGRVLDRDGRPLGDCLVHLYLIGYQTFDMAGSDFAGHFTISNVPTGSFRVVAEHYEFAPGDTCGRQDATATRTIGLTGSTNLELRLRPVRAAAASAADRLVGAIPPDFSAPFFNTNGAFTLSEQIGKVVAVDFWATWCGPCMAQLPETKKVWEKYRDNPDVRFITVSLDSNTNQLRRLLEQKQIDFPVICSGGAWNDSVAGAFGIQAIPTSFVIGRDGRYASEPTHGGGLAAAIENALAQKFDPALTNLVHRPRVPIEVAFEEDGANVPEAVLEIAGEKLALPGNATTVRWPYPGGTVPITASAPGLPAQTREITNAAPVRFRFKSPRTIRGQLVVEGGGISLAGVKVNATRTDVPWQRSALTDRDGRFAIPVMPGTYSLVVEGNDQVAALPPDREDLPSVDVAAEADPPEQRVPVFRAVTIRGRVVDRDGRAIANAMAARPGMSQPVAADADGRFRLPGVPAMGPVTIYAGTEEAVGSRQLTGPVRTNEEYVIEVGVRDSDRSAKLAVGTKWPELKARLLRGGEPMVWRPAADGQTLVVVCALWHPEGRRLLRQAIERAKQTGAHLAAFSVDWTPQQAGRHAAAIPEAAGIFYLGPDSAATEELTAVGPATAVVVAADGRIVAAGRPGQLP